MLVFFNINSIHGCYENKSDRTRFSLAWEYISSNNSSVVSSNQLWCDRKQGEMSFLSVVMCFKNESHILEEWINHYIDEGVDQFVLCDNNSTDDYESILNKFDNIVLFKDDSPSIQLECKSPMSKYGSNIYSKMISDTESEWYIIVDDEFMYSRGQYKTIRDFLKQRGSEFNQLLVPSQFHNKWINEIQEQPESVIDTFTESCHNFITQIYH